MQVKYLPDQKLIGCDESFLGKGFNLPMGQLSRSGRVILVIWPSAKASQLSIRRENGALGYFSTIERDNALLSWSSYISQSGGEPIEWMESKVHVLNNISQQNETNLCRSLWPMASMFSTGILCIFFLASLCRSIPFLAPATSSAKSLWFRSSLGNR